MNISKLLKNKRDAEARLNRASPAPSYIGTGGTPTEEGGGVIPGETYVNDQEVINEISQAVSNQLLAGDNLILTDNGDGTQTISWVAPVDDIIDGGSANSTDFTITFDGGGV